MTLLYVIVLSAFVTLCHSRSKTTEHPHPVGMVDYRSETIPIYQVKSLLKDKSSFIYMDKAQFNKPDNNNKWRRKDGPRFRMFPPGVDKDICTGMRPWRRYVNHGDKNKVLEHFYVPSRKVKLHADWESQGVTGYCSPGFGKCGADLQIYRKQNVEGGGKDVYWSYHPYKSKPDNEDWKPTKCYVWSL